MKNKFKNNNVFYLSNNINYIDFVITVNNTLQNLQTQRR